MYSENIHSLPAELLRKGRFDEIFFVDLPTMKERMEIFRVHMQKRLVDSQVIGQFEVNDGVLERLAQLTEGYVGAEVEQIVISALFEAFSEDRSIDFGDFEKAIHNTVPLSITQAEQIHSIREWANVRAVAATPKEDRTEYKSKKEIVLSPPPKDEDVSMERGGRAVDF